ncbi:T9SS type A sorting domain-containing protein [Aquimarina sp. RZ0]|uniref:T9SS type A sorting domain-containing protein n=1 Tax=Aquimarina sp. RZ0 TaxID=2607730 RepID=UPI0011F0F9BC|nr:T9SS type A sorting domain-containing protein [Aquimarina sp. RZ0]KAA1245068.1 T9SS type A sorting domain-containing protein [Aquimarina sp. RZ0]
MKLKHLLLSSLFMAPFMSQAQKTETKASFQGKVSSVEYVSSLKSRPDDLVPSDNSFREAKDKRSLGNQIISGKDPQTEDDFFIRNRHKKEQSMPLKAADLVFDAYTSGSQPTDPSMAVGPNHVMVVFNTGFAIYDKSGNQLLGQTSPNPAIFPSGGCCDLTASYDNAADRWVLSFLGSGAQVAISDGPDPLTSGWFVYNISGIRDYQKLSVWSDGYYITENTGGTNKLWVLERDAMLAGDPNAQIIGFNLPGIVTSGFFSPQALNVTDDNLPAPGGATIVYLQDDAWNGVSVDHIKVWTANVDWNTPGNSVVSSPVEINTTPFISVFDGGSFSNLTQPNGGIAIDALQATIMNQAQFRKFATHNSAIFNFVVDTDAGSGELAGIRWVEFRQTDDNQPWSLYQEGTYTAPDGRHAWHASMAMDAQGNIGMGYTSMSGPTTPSTVRVSSYYTGRLSTDPLGTMTGIEELIANGTGNIPGLRYGDYSKIDVDPSDDSTFWFINEYVNNGRKGVVGRFQIQAGPIDTQAPTDPSNVAASDITSNSATLNWTASTDNIGVARYNISIDGAVVGTSTSTTFDVTGLAALTSYTASINAEDAAGNVSGSVTTTFTTLDSTGTPGVIAAYFFETGLDGWIDGGSDCRRIENPNRSFEGRFSVRLRDNSSSSNAISPTLNLTNNTEVSIEFHTFANSMEPGEDFFVEFFNGSSYEVIGQYISGTDFSNGVFFTDTIVLNAATYDFNASNNIRFRCDASSNADRIYFDAVTISGDNVARSVTPEPAIETPAETLKIFTQASNDKIKIYPNPTYSQLNIDIADSNFDEITMFSSKGEIVKRIDSKMHSLSIDVSEFASGIYFVRFVSEGLAVTKRFIKK